MNVSAHFIQAFENFGDWVLDESKNGTRKNFAFQNSNICKQNIEDH